MSKNIVIFSDGTGQEGGVGNNTNVYDLFNMIEDRTARQISFYDRGLGTGLTKVGRVSGMGISGNVQECYQFLSDNYDAKDQVYLFGFSRGATTVRTLSAFIHLFGILPRSRPELIKRAWRIYRIGNAKRKHRRAAEFVRLNKTMWAKVRFLGVWDTVAALGLPFKSVDVVIDKLPFGRHSFHDLSLAESVEYARHALAVDDERLTFHPQLWDERSPTTNGGPPDTPPEFFMPEDIDDVYLVAEKLKAADHPVTRRLKLDDKTRKLLAGFDREGLRDESPERKQAVVNAALKAFNKEVFDTTGSFYDPAHAHEFDSINLSPATRKRMSHFKRGMKKHAFWLDRMLVQEAYCLRPPESPRVKQVWFAGMHSDVGGGYAEKELAHIPLVWMVREAMDLGLLVYPRHEVDLSPEAEGVMHDSRARLGRLYRRRQRQWKREQNQGRSPLVHESVIVRNRSEGPLYEPWILKTRYDVEPWSERLMGSIQFDDHHIWRESFWGWDAAFTVPWEAVERIARDERQGAITIHLKGKRKDIVIKGCLPKDLAKLVAQLERHRKNKRLRDQDERLKEQDRRFAELLERLDDKVARLEEHIQNDDARTANLGEKGESRERKFRSEIDQLKAEVEELRQGMAASGGESDAEVVEN